MAARIRDRLFKLLDAIKADFPRRRKVAEELMKTMGLTKKLEMEIEESISVPDSIATFDPTTRRKLTPMLRARFEYAGSWKRGQNVWLSADQTASHARARPIKAYHRSLRENWDESAPAIYSDDGLTLFGITEGVPENLVYLVWAVKGKEPEVWSYAGFEAHRFENLEQYLKWCLERE